jgi:hypothetical protein
VKAFTGDAAPVASSRHPFGTVRFVTALAIDVKPCTYVPLCQVTSQNNFQSDSILGLAARGPKLKTHKSAILLNYFISMAQFVTPETLYSHISADLTRPNLDPICRTE